MASVPTLADILGSQTGSPLISGLPQFGAAAPPDDLVSASPGIQSLLSSVGGPHGLGNLDAMAAANPQMGSLMSLLGPAGGISPQQAQQFGPIFALMMSLQGGAGGVPNTPAGGV